MRVRGAMVDLIRRSLPISRGASERRKMLAEKESELRGELGRDPHPHELAEAMGMAAADLAALRDSSQPLRFDSIDEVYSDQSLSFADEIPDSFTLMAAEELPGSVIRANTPLPPRNIGGR